MDTIGNIGNRHYIRADAEGRVLEGWSDGPIRDRDTEGAVLLRSGGGYQFRLTPEGPENPALLDESGVPLYRWDGERVLARTAAEIAADRALLPAKHKSAEERLDAIEAAIERGVSM